MNFEQRVKAALGEQIFQILALAAELETARARIAELELEKEKAKNPPATTE